MRTSVLACLVTWLLSIAAVAPRELTAASAAPVEKFYERILGDWVGSSTSRFGDQEPTTSFFRLVVTRPDPRTFREEFTYFRRNAQTGALEPSGTQTNVATLEADGSVKCVSTGRGTILIDYKPKKQAWQATGGAVCQSADEFQADVSGTVSVDGMPFGLGRKGRIQKCRARWTLQAGALIGHTELESKFRALIITKRFRVTTELRGERGTDVHAVAARQAAIGRRPR